MNQAEQVVDISDMEYVRDLKQQISLSNGIPMELQRLIYLTKEMEDTELLTNYDLQELSTIWL